MFSNSRKLLLYIKSHSVEIYTEEGVFSKLELPTDVFNYLEIKNQDYFAKILGNFLNSKVHKGDGIIVLLSKQLVFYKDLSEVPVRNKGLEEEKFFNSIPFKRSEILEKKISFGNKTVLLSANKNTIFIVIQIFDFLKLRIMGIFPALLLAGNPTEDKVFNRREVVDIYKRLDQIEDLSLIRVKKTSSNIWIFFILGIVIVVLTCGVIFYIIK